MVAGILLPFFAAATASAGPQNSGNAMPITIHCGGQHYDAVVVGGGWSPAFVVDSKTKLFPTAFISFEGVYIDPDGIPHTDVQPEPEYRGNGNVPANRTTMTCTYTIAWSNPETGESFTGTGVVEGYVK